MMHTPLDQLRKYETRYEMPINIIQSIKFFTFWTFIMILILYSIPDVAWELRMNGFFAIAIIGIWRYSWFLINVFQGLIYEKIVFKKYKEELRKIPLQKKFPKRVYFIIPSYHEDKRITKNVFKFLIEECYKIPSQIYFFISVGSQEEVDYIKMLISIFDLQKKVKVKFLFQSQGKRVALYHALKAVAREFYKPLSFHRDYKNDVLVLMDGDTVVGKNILLKTLPFFIWNTNLGALTTDEEIYYFGNNKLIGVWYKLKFARRHIMMKSHSLHKKVLTLTGRFSAFRAHIMLNEEFINLIAKDHIDHWLFGKFRFLMGDDKTTWFYLLKNGWDMLYIPDVLIFSVENREGSFFKVTTSLMFRWYGNMLRNNWRAIKLGPKRIGSFFIWYAIIDQRISMWTSLIGPTAITLMSLFISPFYWLFYTAWVIFTRQLQIAVLIRERLSLEIITLPLLLYDQWFGSIVKIYTSANLAKQKWSKAKSQTVNISIDTYPLLRKSLPYVLLILLFILFIFFIGVYVKIFKFPDIRFEIFKQAYAEEPLLIPNDGLDDSKSLQILVNSKNFIKLPPGILDFYHPVVINRNNVHIVGNNTIIHSHIKTPGKAVFVIEGKGIKRTIGYVPKTIKEGTNFIPIEYTKQPSDETKFIWVGSPNTDEFLKKIKAKIWKRKYPYIRQRIFRIFKITNNGIKTTDQVDFPIDKNSAVKEISLVKDVIISNLVIKQIIPNADPNKVKFVYKNLYPGYRVDAIKIYWGANIKLYNIDIYMAGRHPINMENSYGISIRNTKIIGAWNKGKKGNGYVRFSKTYNSILENCIIKDIRHMTFQWSSSKNMVKNCKIYVDINFHGGFDRYNTVKNCFISIPPYHKWNPIQKTPLDARWAPPDGWGNKILDCIINIGGAKD